MENQETVTDNTQSEVVDQAEVAETQAAHEPEKAAFDPNKLPDDIKNFVEAQKAEVSKKYADYEQRVAQAREWEQVRNDPRFQEFQRSLSAPSQPKPFEIDDDRYTKALTDKGEFVRLVQEAAKNLLESQVAPQLAQTQNQIQFQNKVAELKETTTKYPDFKDLDSQGKIEPLIRKYPNLSFEDAYWLAKKDDLNAEADRRARGIINQKKAGTTERPNNAPAGRGAKVQVKSRLEAMELAYDAQQAGRPIPEMEYVD